jgi:hypothetical protein
MMALTVAEGKRLIAKAILRTPEVQRARQGGKILLKGGTTVSAVAEELVGVPMLISGRISPRGFKATRVPCDAPHAMLIEGSQWRKVDDELPDVVPSLGDGDVFVIGANLIDAQGGAAMAVGAPLGDRPGRVLAGIQAQGVPILVAAGLEKLIPGSVAVAVRAAGRKGVDFSTGMSVGLIPIFGRVVTEVEAVKLLAPVQCQVIARGGLDGAEGGVGLAVWGEAAGVESIFRLILSLKGAGTSGADESLWECESASRTCKGHQACIYRSPGLIPGAKATAAG